ncbi:hypothetical protein DQG23_33460 [Paenibacillus contaminans]|uniref:Uncharacterized protein n=1 Tax=Paenibacillus contaminans TaxID=450362 RepID=A0A329M8G9_9BACL|nr:hypothetical protein DQG23_33460 [Paenibacillus contaminans]
MKGVEDSCILCNTIYMKNRIHLLLLQDFLQMYMKYHTHLIHLQNFPRMYMKYRIHLLHPRMNIKNTKYWHDQQEIEQSSRYTSCFSNKFSTTIRRTEHQGGTS